MIKPMAAPRNSLAPKRLAADMPTRTGMNMNGAADMTWIMSEIPLRAGFN